ncbi:hypothetical protein BXZ70DRAFT_576251 [Cristinia sonorae]|uniref:Uncharacterized protein n=1 Tax=Cristinia sonorae TaxID=1940300 RepID=A0A8K0UGB4_9AGAR|nr:hypothetical protein BXZ70DRAFT_576251 [Cristinia sonorae]
MVSLKAYYFLRRDSDPCGSDNCPPGSVDGDDDDDDDDDPCGSDTCPTRTSGQAHTRTHSSSHSGTSVSLPSQTSSTPTSTSRSSTSAASPTKTNDLNPQTSASTTPNGGTGSSFNKSAIGGIVIGLFFILALLLAFLMWRRRRRQRQATEGQNMVGGSTADMHLIPGNPPATLPAHNTQGDVNLATATASSSQGYLRPVVYGNMAPSYDHNRASSETILPNPYDGIAQSSLPYHNHEEPRTLALSQAVDERSPAGEGTQGIAAMNALPPLSRAPSAWRASSGSTSLYSDVPDTRASSMISASSDTRPTEEQGLLQEMTAYQKRLESHHRKESGDSVVISPESTSRNTPTEPPPRYTPSVIISLYGHMERSTDHGR